jgi:hypothetical protein
VLSIGEWPAPFFCWHPSLWAAFWLEEILEELGAVGAEDAFGDFDAVVQEFGIGDLELAADAAEAEVAGAKDDAGDAGVDECSGAHDAGFEGAVEDGVFEAVVAEAGGGGAEGLDFGVGGGVVARDGGVVAFGDEFVAHDEDGADGDFTLRGGDAGETQRFCHPPFVGGLAGFVGLRERRQNRDRKMIPGCSDSFLSSSGTACATGGAASLRL